jgi:hypothetical protein
LGQIKEIVDVLEVSVEKREKLYAMINALTLELERERTRFELYAGLVLAAADVGERAAKKFDPFFKAIDQISKAISKAKEREDTPLSLPAPEETKQIEHQAEATEATDTPETTDTSEAA